MPSHTVEIPGFEIVEKVGESALTEVWQAQQENLDRRVNLKFLKDDYRHDEEECYRFVREAQHAANLRHPNIVAIYNVMRHDDRDIVIMEHIEGPTIYELLSRRGAMPWETAARVALCVAQSLAYAWDEARLIHRNISPSSVRMEDDGTVKVAYIGLSMRVDPLHPTRRTEPGCIEGVPYYMSPEQARGATDLDFRTDMYALGTTLYHMLTGHMPFSDFAPIEALQQQIDGVLPYPTQFGRDIPSSLLFMLSKLMRKSPRNRYKSWDDVARDLKKILDGHLIVPRNVKQVASTLPADIHRTRAPAQPHGRRRKIIVRKR
jgi:serine/threonine-protein kinase